MLYQTANDSIMAIHKGKLIDCNAKTLEIFRCAKQQIVGRPPLGIISGTATGRAVPQGKTMEEKIELALQGSPQFFEWKYRRSDDSVFDAEVSLHRIEYRGKIIIQGPRPGYHAPEANPRQTEKIGRTVPAFD